MNWLLKLFKNIVGPTAVMAAGTMGAGSVASFILAGAWFRYELLWLILVMVPVFVIGLIVPHALVHLTMKKECSPSFVSMFIQVLGGCY